jgi:hypothetical protein
MILAIVSTAVRERKFDAFVVVAMNAMKTNNTIYFIFFVFRFSFILYYQTDAFIIKKKNIIKNE